MESLGSLRLIDTDVTIVIPNWNRADLLLECLRSIDGAARAVHCGVVVVDNASTDDSVARVREDFPAVHLIPNSQNRGFAAACNQGLREGLGRYGLLLNNDAFLQKECLDLMVRYMDAHPDTGALTCKQLDASTMLPMPPCATAFPTPGRVFLQRLVRLFRLPQRFPNRRWWKGWTYLAEDPEREHEAAHITGACLLIRREAVQQVGLLDEEYYLYLEETDWCMRLRQAEWKIRYIPEAAFVHHLSASGQLRDDREELYFRSYCRFFEKHYGKASLLAYRLEKMVFNLVKRVSQG